MTVLSQPLADAGPLNWMAAGIKARLQEGFPDAYFDFAWMPAKVDRAWFAKAFRRTALVALGWEGCTAEGEGAVFAARAHWTVALVTKNPNPQSRYTGDALAPGLFAMTRVATLLLNGFHIDPEHTAWSATRTIEVSEIGNLYDNEWGSEDLAVAAMKCSVLYEECVPPGLEQTPGAALNVNVAWNFGEQPPAPTSNLEGV